MQPCAAWPLDPACSYGLAVDPADQSEAVRAALLGATEVLWRWTAGVFGLCPLAVRPCRSWCGAGADWRPELVGGRWLNISCGCPSAGACSCGPICAVELPGPVNAVLAVTVDGATLDPGAYRVDNHSRLVRVDGGCWPPCQDMTAPPTAPGTWQVAYEQGLPVPPGGQRAVGALAAELLRSCAGVACRLPGNATNVSREGVTLVVDTSGLAAAGRTGLPEVDLWVAAVNPNRLHTPSAVYSVDIPPPVVTTWPPPAPFGAPVRPLGDAELGAADAALAGS